MKWTSLGLALLAVASATAQKQVSVPTDIRNIYDIQKRDLEKGDWNHFFTFYDPTFVNTGTDGKKLSLADLKKEVEDMTKGTTKRMFSIKFTGCRASATMVDVSYVADFTYIRKGGKGQTFREVGTDTWKKEGKAWKEVQTFDKSFGLLK